MSKPRCEVINDIIARNNLINPSYLEIGVWLGITFRDVKTDNKDGVDPGQYCECSDVNFKMTSDVFSKHIVPKNTTSSLLTDYIRHIR